MPTEVSICNRALMMVGAGRIQSIDDTQSAAARACKAIYDELRDEVMTRHEWQFAKARKVLSQLSTAPAFGFSYAYQLPTDCLRALRLENVLEVGKEIYWEIEGDQLFCDLEEDVQLHYIKKIENTALFSATFVNALTLRLSSDLAIILKKDKELQRVQLDIYEKLLPEMERTDARSENMEVQGMDASLGQYAAARGD